jgi:hypothetical protein
MLYLCQNLKLLKLLLTKLKKGMKKIMLSLLLVGVFALANAQDVNMKTKRGENILPEKGDWAIGICADPMFEYFGNFIGKGSLNPTPIFDFYTDDFSIIGKYFVSDKMAFRGRLRIGMNSNTNNAYVNDDASKTDPFAQVKDKQQLSNTNVTIGAGVEMRKGKGRLQGVYGAEANIFFGGGKDKYTYGNAITSDNNFPTTHNFGDNVIYDKAAVNPYRTTEYKYGSTFGLGVRAFIGAEYFVLPKLSIGGEFGWGIGFASTGDDELTAEGWDAANSTVGKITQKAGNGGGFGIDTDNLGGGMYIMLHF